MLNPTVAINYAKVIMNNKSIDIDKLYACFYNVSVFLSEHPLLDYALKNQFIIAIQIQNTVATCFMSWKTSNNHQNISCK